MFRRFIRRLLPGKGSDAVLIFREDGTAHFIMENRPGAELIRKHERLAAALLWLVVSESDEADRIAKEALKAFYEAAGEAFAEHSKPAEAAE